MNESFFIKTFIGILTLIISGMGKRMWDMSKEISDKASYDWVERHIASARDDNENSHREILDTVKDIRDAIIGDMDKPGLRGIVSDVDKRVTALEDKIK